VLGVTVGGDAITVIDGWNWYTGSDPGAIATNQFDFQTVVTHELGHAIGLGHSGDTASVMYPFLQAGVARRDLSAGDLSVLDQDAATGPEPLRTLPFARAADAGPNPAVTGEAITVILPESRSQVIVGGLSMTAPASSPSMPLAASVAPSVRVVVVVSGTPIVPARPVQPLIDLTAVGARSSWLDMIVDEHRAPGPDGSASPAGLPLDRGPAIAQAAPIVSSSLLRSWDDAIDAHIAEGHELARPLDALAQSPAVAIEPAVSPLESALLAGAALAVWGAWEVRSRKDDRRRPCL
jgi:hypothetical protein